MEYNEERLELIWNIIMGDRTLESLSIDERCKLGFMQELDNSELNFNTSTCLIELLQKERNKVALHDYLVGILNEELTRMRRNKKAEEVNLFVLELREKDGI